MSITNHMSDGFHSGNVHASPEVRLCGDNCLERSQQAFESALKRAHEMGCSLAEIDRRFKFLLDAASNPHERSEIMLEYTLAIYELMYGQEHITVAYMLSVLAKLQAAHGKDEYGRYLKDWGSDIMNASRQEPTHEFFALFGYDQEMLNEASKTDSANS
jgi:hypothetical protein